MIFKFAELMQRFLSVVHLSIACPNFCSMVFGALLGETIKLNATIFMKETTGGSAVDAEPLFYCTNISAFLWENVEKLHTFTSLGY